MKGLVKLTASVALRILELQEHRCALTGRALTPETAVLDHIVPLAKGGQHVASNIWVLHKEVNQFKGKLLLPELYAMCEQILANRDRAQTLQMLASDGWSAWAGESAAVKE